MATEKCFPNLDMFKEIDIQSKFWVNLVLYSPVDGPEKFTLQCL